MNDDHKLLNNENGFTLVELMVVVAIIGLLSAVAIPNFKKYQAKSKVTEAKLQLAALYTAESSFFSDYNMYASCLRYMGYDPTGERLNRYYAVGFTDAIADRNPNAHAAAVNSGLKEEECPESVVPANESGIGFDMWYRAGKAIGSSVVDDITIAIGNGAAIDPGACDSTSLSNPGYIGTCLGDQSTFQEMTFQASAVGYISAEKSSPISASGLNINHLKILKNAVAGY